MHTGTDVPCQPEFVLVDLNGIQCLISASTFHAAQTLNVSRLCLLIYFILLQKQPKNNGKIRRQISFDHAQ